MINTGLKELKEDPRDFQLGAIFSLPMVESLPDTFLLPQPKVKDQKNSDLCSAFATTSMSEIQEGIELSPLYSFALGKSISGDPEKWGQDLRTAMKAHVKYGDMPEAQAWFPVSEVERDEIRYLENWRVEEWVRELYKKKSYFKIGGWYDSFDNIRASIWKFRDKKQAVAIGLTWSWNPNEKFLTVRNSYQGQFGHAMCVLGWETIEGETFLVAQNSFGNCGEGGLHWISRDIINSFVDKYGAFMMVDLESDEAKKMIDRGITEHDNYIVRLFKIALSIIKKIVSKQ